MSQSLRKSGRFLLTYRALGNRYDEEWSQSLRKSGRFLRVVGRRGSYSLAGMRLNPFVSQVGFFRGAPPGGSHPPGRGVSIPS